MTSYKGARILIDGTMARGGGGFTYLVNILPQPVRAGPDDRFRVLLRSERLARSIAPAAEPRDRRCCPRSSWLQRLRFTYRELPRLAQRVGRRPLLLGRRDRSAARAVPDDRELPQSDRLHALDPGCSLEAAPAAARAARDLARSPRASCDRIMFVSEDSARWIGDAARRAGGSAARSSITASTRPRGRADGARPPRPIAPPYILSVSSIYRHKNYVRLIEAYASLARRRDDMPDLVIIGDVQDPEYAAQMERARVAAGEELAERIHILGEVPYAEIKAYYARRRAVRVPVLPRDVRPSAARGDGERHADGGRRHPGASARSPATRRSTPIRTRPRRSPSAMEDGAVHAARARDADQARRASACARSAGTRPRGACSRCSTTCSSERAAA